MNNEFANHDIKQHLLPKNENNGVSSSSLLKNHQKLFKTIKSKQKR